MKKIMLIAGCSHAAGSEIDGSEDSVYNRNNAFGSVLANKLGFEPVNIASNGATNPTIARSIIEWVNCNYDKDSMEVFVLVAWTESSRVEVPVNRECQYQFANPASPWKSLTENLFLRINQGYTGCNEEEKQFISQYHKFIANNLEYLEILSANLVLQIQYFLKANNIDYVMCNTLHNIKPSKHLKFYLEQIDSKKYLDFDDPDKSFFWYYRNAGYENPKAKYWHHDHIPHTLYAEKLYNFIQNDKSTCLT